MGTLLVYSLLSVWVLTLLYLPLRWVLKAETSPRCSRMALLSVLLSALVLPLLLMSRSAVGGAAVTGDVVLEALPEMPGLALPADVGPVVSWTDWVALIYVVGLAASLFGLALRIVQLRRVLSKHCLWTRREPDGTRIWCTAAGRVAYSWMHHIVLSEELCGADAREILLHEKAHVHMYHSWDTLLTAVLRCLQWYNPLMLMVESSLRDVHEYEADAAVLAVDGVDARHYQMLLIKKAADPCSYALVSSSNHSSLKKRMTMMFKKQSSPWMRLRYLYVLPAVGFAVSASALSGVQNLAEEISKAEVSHLFADGTAVSEKMSAEVPIPVLGRMSGPSQDNETVCDNPEVKPEFPGGEMALIKHLIGTVKYPAQAFENGIEGQVVLSFVVEKDGSLSDIKILRSPDELLTAEAIRVVKTMPKWKPGMQNGKVVRSRFSLPVSFRLSGGSPEKKSEDKGLLATHQVSEQVAYLVDGKWLSHDEVKKIKSEDIKQVDVIKAEKAKALFGERGANGVVVITTKPVQA